MNTLFIFASIGIIHGLFYSIWGNQIFDYFNIDIGIEEKKEDNVKKAPCSWKIERFLHRFIGVFIGWIIIWFLVDKRLHIFSGYSDVSFGIPDILLFIFGFVGINGRLPSIAHSIEKWFGMP